MSAIERAAELGAEHGRRDAEKFVRSYPKSARTVLVNGRGWPEPDAECYRDAGVAWAQSGDGIVSYEAAYQDAVQERLRELVTP